MKELSRRLDRQGRQETDGKMNGAAEIQLVQTRLAAVQEETRLTVENGKRWSDQERERMGREVTDLVRKVEVQMTMEFKELRQAVHQLDEKTHVDIDNNGQCVRRSDGKSKHQLSDQRETKIRQNQTDH